MRLFTILFLFLPFITLGQQDYEKAIIETETGGKIIFTNDSNSFIIELDTASIRPIEDKRTLFLDVDKKWMLQLFTVDFQNVKKLDTKDLEVQKSFILKYIEYEKKYFKEELKLGLDNIKIKSGTINNHRFICWYFDTPEYETAQKQIFLTTICFDHFLNINIPLPNDATLAEGISFLKRIGKKLTRYNHSTDIESIYKEVNGIN